MTINEIVDHAVASGRNLLFEDEAGALLKAAGIPVNSCRVASDEDEAVQVAKETGFPVALKVRSRTVTHKTDAGGVRLGLADEEAVRLAYRGIMEKVRMIDPESQVTVQPMASPGVELLVGMTTDPQFGQVVAFGLGGTLVELFNDITYRQVPLLKKDATDMINSIKGSAVLKGYRGRPPVDINALTGIILKVSRLVEKEPRIKEIDLNPVFAYPQGMLAVDSRIVVCGNP
ncbi:MAG: succinyl-CoA synthetase subunit beta [Pelotomaculum sp. PtaB.Bin013]|uniref:Acetate--CoA ligase family protein n=1 Tax=Pelotomaculum isophthalicicum JI TaxID=947010 RepID=A0A9X4H953_9FIRM|nr:acetate--CoA ligase family protein [Pelotomaculum isophthalicicum]MDF9409709.1 acetate--CoA ligase family protein [Pelotomaculum isophthalicicum JI]OPX83220.1 MAG: succinyl-CoA synthetase subunit beta [Pelotomaculum sp. PtaB.Bin013]